MAQSEQHHPTNRRRAIWNMLKIALAVILIGIILSQTSTADLIALWRQISLPWLLGSVLAFYAMIWSMARRYWLLIGKSVAFPEFLSLVIVQTVVGNMIATSAGALSYVAILRSKHQIEIHQGLASLVISRLGDVLALFVALACSSWAIWPQIAVLHWLVAGLAAGLAGVLLAATLIVLLRQRFIAFVERSARLLRLDRLRITRRMIQILADLAQRDLQGPRGHLGAFIGYSALTLMLMFAFGYCNTRMFGVPIGAWSILFMLALTQIIALIPIQVFGGLGVYDLTSMYLYSLFGFGQSQIAP
ncbi:MAG: YbhN family protein, partial [Roseiflexaceae bacterium]